MLIMMTVRIIMLVIIRFIAITSIVLTMAI